MQTASSPFDEHALNCNAFAFATTYNVKATFSKNKIPSIIQGMGVFEEKWLVWNNNPSLASLKGLVFLRKNGNWCLCGTKVARFIPLKRFILMDPCRGCGWATSCPLARGSFHNAFVFIILLASHPHYVVGVVRLLGV